MAIAGLYRFINNLSLDVAVGAVICAYFFATVLNSSIRPYGFLALGLTVWIIYTADHLLDARKVKEPAASARHRFHQRYFKLLRAIVVIAIVLDISLILYIRKPIIKSGFMLGALVGLYFLSQRYLIYVKEFFGALLYTGGVLLAPLSVMEHSLSSMEMILILEFLLTALVNLLLFTLFDRARDLKDKHQSFATIFGEKATQTMLSILFVLNASLAAIQIKNNYFLPAVIILLMNIVLLVILLNRKYFSTNERFRLLGDAVFFLPLIYFLMQP